MHGLYCVSSLLPEILISTLILTLVLFICLSKIQFGSERIIITEVRSAVILTLICSVIILLNYIDFGNENILFVESVNIYINKLIVTIMALVAVIFLPLFTDIHKISSSEFYVIFLFSFLSALMIIGVNNLIMFYLLIETQTVSFYLLASFNRTNIFSVEAGLKYFIAGAFMSSFLLLGMVCIYSATGSLNLPDIKMLLEFGEIGIVGTIGVFLVIIVLLFKASAVPFHWWAPDVYEGAPISSTFIFTILPKYALIFFFIKWLKCSNGILYSFQDLLVIYAVLSTFIGTVFAMKQLRFKRMLIYSSIAQTGFILGGLAMGTDYGNTTVLFFVIIYLITSLVLWSLLAVIYLNLNSKGLKPVFVTYFSNITPFSTGVSNAGNIWALAFITAFFSIGGIPPFVGFVSKTLVLDALVKSDFFITAISLIVISSVSMYYYLRILKVSFFEYTGNKIGNNKDEALIMTGVQKYLGIYALIVAIILALLLLFFNSEHVISLVSNTNLIDLPLR